MRAVLLLLALALVAGCKTTGYGRAVGNDIGRGINGAAAGGAVILEAAVVGVYYAGKGIVHVIEKINERESMVHGGLGDRPRINRRKLFRLHEKRRREIEPEETGDLKKRWRRAKRKWR